jgi:predicted DNA-binding ribbon-helix-helix protein
MKSVIKRPIVIAGNKMSVSLEDAFWSALNEITGGCDTTLSDLITIIDADRHRDLSSAIRLFVLGGVYRDQLASHDQISSRQSRTLETLFA